MILNALSIGMIFIDLLSVLLVLWGGASSVFLYKKWKKSSTQEERTFLEDRSYLVLLIMVIVLLIRLINWPLFYGTLQSFIHDIEGAMCIFGVTQVKPGLTLFLEYLKPINFFFIGGWLILHTLDRATKTAPLMGRNLLLLSGLSLLILIDSIGDIFLMVGVAPESLVSCCTTVTDILNRPTRTTPESIFGPQYAEFLKILYFITHLLLIGMVGLVLKLKKLENTFSWRRGVLGLLFLLALLNGVVFVLSQIEVFAPQMMHLPFHHCLYCLWQYVPDTIVMYLLLILGTFSVGWAFTTDLFGKIGEASDLLPKYLRKIYWFGFSFLSASLVMLIVHLILD